MKKLLKSLVVLLLLVSNLTMVAGAGFATTMTAPSTIAENEEFSVTVGVSGAKSLMGFTAKLTYDSSKITFVSATGSNGFTVTVGTNLVVDAQDGKDGTYAVATLKFKATSSFKVGESVTIGLSGVNGSDGSSDIEGSGISRTISIPVPKSSNNNLSALTVDGVSVPNFKSDTLNYDLGTTDKTSMTIGATVADAKASVSGARAVNLAYGRNVFDVVVTAENGAKKTYKVTVTRNDPRSTNNFLSSLTLSVGSIEFNKNTNSYTVIVDNDVSSITIGASAEDSKSSVSGTGNKSLQVYSNTFSVVVTAENQTRRTYTLNIVRRDAQGNAGELSKNTKLKTLKIIGIDFEYLDDISEYEFTVDNTVSSLEIIAEVDDVRSAVKYENASSLRLGRNEVRVIVTSESGDERIIKLFVTRSTDVPTVPLEDVSEIIGDIGGNDLVSVIGSESMLTPKILQALKISKKNLYVQKQDESGKVLYEWKFEGNNVSIDQIIETKITFESDFQDKIEFLTNYTKAVVLNFGHQGALPLGTLLRVYVGDEYKDGDILQLYFYNPTNESFELKKQNIVVEDGYVQFEILHCSDYLLTKASLHVKDPVVLNPWMLASIAQFFILMGLAIYWMIRRKTRFY